MRRAATLIVGGKLAPLLVAVALAQTTPPKPASAPTRKSPSPGALPSYHDLKYPELRSIAAPAVESATLPNGMRLLLLEDHELPLVNGTVMVRTGTVFDPSDKRGLAALTAQLMLEGGKASMPGGDPVQRFQNLGGEIAGGASENSVSISFSVLRESSDAALDLVKEVLAETGFPQDRLDIAKTAMRSTIAHRNDDPRSILRREFGAAVYGKSSPYGWSVENPNIDRIERADLVAFHQRYFFPKNVILALSGDFDAAAMKARVAAVFGDWTTEQPPVPEFPKASDAGSGGKFLATVKSLQQSYFTVGQAAIEYTDKDAPAMAILSGILGGPESRLNQRLLGAVDGLSVTWSPGFGHPGLFEITGTVVNPFVTTEVLQTISEELASLRSAEVSEQQLTAAKNATLNKLVFEFDNEGSILPRLAQYAYFNLPADYTQAFQRRIQSVSRADVLRVAAERLDPVKMVTVVVGNPIAFERPLESLGGSPVTSIDLTIAPSKPEAVVGDAVSQQRAKQILAKAQDAMGGAAKLAAVTDYVQASAYQFDASVGGSETTLTERWIAPGYLRQDNVTPTAKYSVYCDGKSGWVANEYGSNPLVDVGLKQVQTDLFHNLFPLLLSDRSDGRKITALDDATVEISEAGMIVKIVVDPASGLLKSIFYDAPTVNGPVPVIETYSDFRDVSGLKLPFKESVTLSGKKYSEITVKSIQLNTGLKVQDLEKRP